VKVENSMPRAGEIPMDPRDLLLLAETELNKAAGGEPLSRYELAQRVQRRYEEGNLGGSMGTRAGDNTIYRHIDGLNEARLTAQVEYSEDSYVPSHRKGGIQSTPQGYEALNDELDRSEEACRLVREAQKERK
jgi:hypothetical protein